MKSFGNASLDESESVFAVTLSRYVDNRRRVVQNRGCGKGAKIAKKSCENFKNAVQNRIRVV